MDGPGLDLIGKGHCQEELPILSRLISSKYTWSTSIISITVNSMRSRLITFTKKPQISLQKQIEVPESPNKMLLSNPDLKISQSGSILKCVHVIKDLLTRIL